ncbi:MAG: hypothetical protein K8R48_02410 [Alphaproteobacteria bacterium]|nr:hypothetical protein [Alphaproteobacteria bacterium]
MTDSVKKKKRRSSASGLTPLFNNFAKKAIQDFPKLKDKFALYSMPTDSWHGKSANDNKTDALLDELLIEAENHTDVAFAYQTSGRYLMAYVSNHKTRAMSSAKEPYEREILAVLEHELGHLVAPAGHSDKHSENFGECVADTFSFIRQQQQHASIQRPLEATIWISLRDFVLHNESLHLTAPALTELLRLSQEHDLSQLTPVQSANLAYRLSLQHAYSKKQLRELEKIFEPVRRNTDPEAALKECAEIMLADHGEYSPTVFTIGKTLLEPFLNQNMDILTSVMSRKKAEALKLEGKFWNDIRTKIKNREAAQAKETPEQKLAREAKDLQALGHFDRQPDKIIGPKKYESKENRVHLASAREDYVAKTAVKRGIRPPC